MTRIIQKASVHKAIDRTDRINIRKWTWIRPLSKPCKMVAVIVISILVDHMNTFSLPFNSLTNNRAWYSIFRPSLSKMQNGLKSISQLFKTIFQKKRNLSVFESQIKIELIIHQMWKTSSEITRQYLILFHCQKWSPKSSRLQPLRPTCPLRKQTALRAKNFRYQKWKHFVEGFFSTNSPSL